MIRLFLIGMVMGIADLIPGVSGGSIAFICGIYEELLDGIKTLQLHSLKKIAWPFLLPLGCGILFAVFFVSRLFYYLLFTFPIPLFAFFFGLILASAFFCSQKAALKRGSHWIPLCVGALLSFFIAGMSENHLFGLSFMGLATAGFLAAFAMLLPGISGSYFLQICGLYPFVLAALNAPSAPGSITVILAIGLGASLGFIFFARVISLLMAHLSTWTYATLVGFMLGGTRAIWPFYKEEWAGALLFSLLGFLFVMLLELKMKKNRTVRKV